MEYILASRSIYVAVFLIGSIFVLDYKFSTSTSAVKRQPRRVAAVQLRATEGSLDAKSIRLRSDSHTSGEIRPFVTLLTLSAGQTYLDRNVMQNLMYQSYPHDRLELLVIDTNNIGPSTTLMYWNNTLAKAANRRANDWPGFRYYFFEPNSTFSTGGKRNFLMARANGDIIIHVDNDDMAMSNYVESIVAFFIESARKAQRTRANAEIRRITGKPRAVTDSDGLVLTSRCCHDKPGQGPYLRDMVVQTASTQGTFQPDGTVEWIHFNASSKLGALTSYTAAVAKNCEFRNRQVQEEMLFLRCAREKFAVHLATAEDLPGRNSQLLLRMIHPLSITNLVYFTTRQKWNQLDAGDMNLLYQNIAWWYEFMHEATRPLSIPPLPVKNVGDTDATRKTSLWDHFHAKHASLLTEGRYPYCQGFVATPGQTWPGRSQKIGEVTVARSGFDCCNQCTLSNNISTECAAWTFFRKSKQCQMVFADPANLPRVSSGSTLNVSQWYNFESAVSQKVCPKCAKGFKPLQRKE